MPVKAFGVQSAEDAVQPLSIERREVGPEDVAIDIQYCGICHSDIHAAHNDWGRTKYPLVPGHEIVGRVTAVGSDVSDFKPGDLVGVGCIVDSCLTCPSCKEHEEQYCENGMVGTYGGTDRHLGGHTFGGYSENIIVRDKFVLRIPESLDTKAVAPLLCAGITSWSPLRKWNVGKGMKVGVVGLGGLGHMGVKFASAMGAHVVMITTSPEKGEDAKKLGAHEVLISKDRDAMASHFNSFDFILNTVPVKHSLSGYMMLLKKDGTMVLVGAIEPLEIHGGLLMGGRKRLSGSGIGGIRETQEMIDFCAEHDIVPEVEMISMDEVNDAWARVQSGDVKYRFVIDMATL